MNLTTVGDLYTISGSLNECIGLYTELILYTVFIQDKLGGY